MTLDENEFERLQAEQERIESWLSDQDEIESLSNGVTISFTIGSLNEYIVDDNGYLNRSEVHTSLRPDPQFRIISGIMLHLPPAKRKDELADTLDQLGDKFSWFDGTRRGYGVKQLERHCLPHIAIVDDVDYVDVDEAISAVEVGLEYYNKHCS